MAFRRKLRTPSTSTAGTSVRSSGETTRTTRSRKLAQASESDGRIDLAEYVEKRLPARRERKTVDAEGQSDGPWSELNESEESGLLSKSNGSGTLDNGVTSRRITRSR